MRSQIRSRSIFAPSNTVDPIMGWWAYYVALIGGFNYISKELGQTRPYQSFYTYSPEEKLSTQPRVYGRHESFGE